MSYSALSDSFKYLWYGSTAIRSMFTLTVQGSTESDVCRRQILMTKVDPCTVRVKARNTNNKYNINLKNYSYLFNLRPNIREFEFPKTALLQPLKREINIMNII